jgi:hemerythrin
MGLMIPPCKTNEMLRNLKERYIRWIFQHEPDEETRIMRWLLVRKWVFRGWRK